MIIGIFKRYPDKQTGNEEYPPIPIINFGFIFINNFSESTIDIKNLKKPLKMKKIFLLKIRLDKIFFILKF